MPRTKKEVPHRYRKVWISWGPYGRPVAVQSFKEAVDIATQTINSHRGRRTVYIYEAVAVVEATPPPVKVTKLRG